MSRREPRRAQAQEVVDWLRPRRTWRNYPLIPWRWRYELGLVAAVAYGVHLLRHSDQPGWTAVAIATIVALVVAVRPARRVVAQRVRAVVTQHRLRAGMVESNLLSWSGWLPAILWTSPDDGGVVLHVWCVAGVDVEMFRERRNRLAAACWAADVEVNRHERWSQVVVVRVVTRPPGETGARTDESDASAGESQ